MSFSFQPGFILTFQKCFDPLSYRLVTNEVELWSPPGEKGKWEFIKMLMQQQTYLFFFSIGT